MSFSLACSVMGGEQLLQWRTPAISLTWAPLHLKASPRAETSYGLEGGGAEARQADGRGGQGVRRWRQVGGGVLRWRDE